MRKDLDEIWNRQINWAEKEINIKTLLNENFKNYISGLDIDNFRDPQNFYQKVKAMIKPKRGKIVKGIKEVDFIHMDGNKTKLVQKIFNNIYDDNPINYKIKNNSIFDFTQEIEYALSNLSKGKAWGTDGIPDEIFKNEDTRSKMAVKLRYTFSQFLRNGNVLDYLMMVKLILISKDNTNTLTINKVRLIGVLPAITKLFELSIINKL